MVTALGFGCSNNSSGIVVARDGNSGDARLAGDASPDIFTDASSQGTDSGTITGGDVAAGRDAGGGEFPDASSQSTDSGTITGGDVAAGRDAGGGEFPDASSQGTDSGTITGGDVAAGRDVGGGEFPDASSQGTDSGTITGGDVAAGRDAGGGEGDGGPISDTGETFLVPMYEENTSSAGILESGVAYIISVGGTYSLWPSTDWTLVCAGTPESAPEFSTSESGPVSNDAEWLFAWPMIASFCARGAVPPVAFHALQFAVDGSTYVPLQPSEKLLTADHVYHYSVIGAGSPLGIYVTDGVNAWDNYGALQVTITR
ncbi:MAG: hypothetical protein WBV96_03795 [Polyangia bacterium]